MKQQVLKALANPARIFYVPYTLAVLNFAVQFIVFIVVFYIDLAINKTQTTVDPLYFILSVCAVHMVLAAVSKHEPQMGNIIASMIQLIKRKIPKKLAA